MKQGRLSLHGHRRFHPPKRRDTPRDIFTEGGRTHSEPRFRRADDGSEILTFVAGCSLNESALCRAVGYGIKSSNESVNGGYLHQPQAQSRNRAVLQAAIRVLHEVQAWDRVYVHRLVLACSSGYLVNGVYARVGLGRRWLHTCTQRIRPDPHEDLWIDLMRQLRRCDEYGLSVQFWKIPLAVNEANSVAQSSAMSSVADMNHIPPKISQLAREIDKM